MKLQFCHKKFSQSRQILLVLSIAILSLVSVFHNYSTIYINSDDEEDRLRYGLKGPLAPQNEALIQYIRNFYLIPPSTDNYNLSKDLIYKRGVSKSYTWKFIDDKLHEFFDKQPPGFFIEAGALDGEALSNTLWLEQKRGWSGLLVEPDPMNFAALRRKNRKAWSSQCCLSTRPFPEETTFSSIVIKEKKINNDWDKKGLTHSVIKGFKYNDDQMDDFNIYFTVQCLPLESLLLALNVTVVDFLSLDIQGGEWEVLKLFPYEKVKLRAIVVEYYNIDKKQGLNTEFIEFMSAKGFQLVGTSYEPDYFFILSNDSYFRQLKIPRYKHNP